MEGIHALKSFKIKITLSILGVGLIALLLGLSLTYWVGRTHLQDTIGSQYRELAFETSQKLQFLIQHHIKEAKLLALASDVRTGVEQTNAAYSNRRMSDSDVQKRIRTLKSLWDRSQGVDSFVEGFLNNPASDFLQGSLRSPSDRAAYLSIIVTDQRGILVGADIKPHDVYFGDFDWWKASYADGRGSIYISDVQIQQEGTDEFEKKYSITIAVPIMDPSGEKAIGVLRNQLQIQQFFEAVTQVHIGKGDHTMLASSDGTLIFCPIFMIRNHTLLPKLMDAIFGDQPGWAITTADVHYGGQKSINGFAPVKFDKRIGEIHPSSLGGKEWYIFTSQNPRTTYAPINTLLNWMLSSVGLGAVLLMVLGLRAAERVVRPLRDLQKGAKLIGFGNLDHRLKIQTGDEIQALADEFNDMAIKLQASYTGLEQKVAERTQELAVINKITRVISSSLDVTQIFESLGQEVYKILPFDRISLALLDEKFRQIQLRLIKSQDGPLVVHDVPRPKTGTAIGWVVHHRRPLIRNDVTEQIELFEDRLIFSEGLRSYIVAPIVSQKTVIGTLNMASRRPGAYSDRNLEILVPITEQLAIAVETIRLFEQTKKLDRLKSEFVSKVSHELRTPLTSIKGFTEILLSYNDVDSKTQRDFISIIHEESERLTRLINDILDLSKIEAGRIQWEIRRLSPFDIAHHAVKSVQAIAMEKDLTVEMDVPEDLPPVRGDRDQLIQVLDNLLSNAIKFTSFGKISVQAEIQDSHVVFSVSDTGLGIVHSEAEKIFDKFYQVGDTRSGKPRGTGLGLAICREIVNYLGGKIWCESRKGKGSVFRFTVPIWSDLPAPADTGTPVPLTPSHGPGAETIEEREGGES